MVLFGNYWILGLEAQTCERNYMYVIGNGDGDACLADEGESGSNNDNRDGISAVISSNNYWDFWEDCGR